MFYRTLAVLPALVGRVGRPRRRAVAQRRLVPRRAHRRNRLEPAGPARRPVAADTQHESVGRGAHRPHARPAGGGDDRVELEPAGDRPQRRAHPSRPGPRRPLHRRPRAVPHRHRPLRRHRAAGHHPTRVDRCRAGVGTPVDGVERGGDRPARRVVQQHRALPPPRRGDGPHRAGPLRRRRDTAHPGARREGRPRRAPSRRMAARAVPGRRPPVGRGRVPHGVGEGRVGERAAGGDGPAGAADVRGPARRTPRRRRPGRPLPAAVAHAQAPHPVPELELLRAPEARPRRGRPVRRARCR